MPDSNFSVFHLDVVRAQLNREVELVLSRPHVVLPAVPWAREHAAFQAAFAQRALEMKAVLLDGVEAAGAVREGDLLVPSLHGTHRSRWHVLDLRNGDEPLVGHSPER